MPSFAMACAAASRLGRSQQPEQTPAPQGAQADTASSAGSGVLQAQSTYYLVNPGGDLPATQAAFHPWFTQLPGWQVCLESSLPAWPAAPACIHQEQGLQTRPLPATRVLLPWKRCTSGVALDVMMSDLICQSPLSPSMACCECRAAQERLPQPQAPSRRR